MKREIILGVDAADQFYLGYEQGYLYGQDKIRELIRHCAEVGITTVYWRVSMGGQVTYRSKVRTIVGWQKDLPEQFGCGSICKTILHQCNPPEVAADEAHRCGIKLYAYVTLFDEYHPGMESEFEIAHPQFTWKHRMFDHRLRGLLSYAYPEVREHRLAELRELIACGVDGIYLDTARTHAGIQPVMPLPLTGKDQYLQYGFNEPEVEEFKRRYGINPGQFNPADANPKDFDWRTWYRFRGEYLTQFLREARELTRRENVNLTAGFYTDAETYLSPAGRRGRVPMGLFHHDIETWVEEDLADAFVLILDHRRFGDRDWREHSAPQFDLARQKGKKVYITGATESRIDELDNSPVKLPVTIQDDRKGFLKALEHALRSCLSQSADGLYLYEAYDIDKHQYWNDLKIILK
jgi:hypothetical protein